MHRVLILTLLSIADAATVATARSADESIAPWYVADGVDSLIKVITRRCYHDHRMKYRYSRCDRNYLGNGKGGGQSFVRLHPVAESVCRHDNDAAVTISPVAATDNMVANSPCCNSPELVTPLLASGRATPRYTSSARFACLG